MYSFNSTLLCQTVQVLGHFLQILADRGALPGLSGAGRPFIDSRPLTFFWVSTASQIRCTERSM
ncbi:hypothetical protein EAH78_26335 [Pseudomonas arsenicoxydans]|uniref:Uncharacterized protein n=1 Tax=Pseudomonas arsenicoxydans TaxID=702115 RepID=A0A502HGY3_9PSED|nr:hypothetical protein EAH78_26335 [Pseudomonas arsenicoxydans]